MTYWRLEPVTLVSKRALTVVQLKDLEIDIEPFNELKPFQTINARTVCPNIDQQSHIQPEYYKTARRKPARTTSKFLTRFENAY